jgi:pyruvate ferredoxin oxidoreductase delta subunit
MVLYTTIRYINERRRENVLPLSRPAPASAGMTGTWRTYRPVPNLQKCIDCGLCWLYCPESVIDWEKGQKIQIDYTYCKGCGICAEVCPVKAIDMVPEEL